MLFYGKQLMTGFFILVLANACKSQASLGGGDMESSTDWAKKELLFEDSGTKDWTQKWFLDGQRARIDNVPMGMYYAAGPEPKNDTCHAVLWTKKTFEGNILIEFDYTRVDTMTSYVNILYFHATRKGGEDSPKDISRWNEKRKVPKMTTYYRNMNAYHISFAAFRSYDDGTKYDYIRLRRYHPAARIKLAGSEILPDKFETGLFKPFHNYHIKVARYENEIEMEVQNKNDAQERLLLRWDASTAPLCQEGRIGLRHMYTRASIYKDFKVWRIDKK